MIYALKYLHTRVWNKKKYVLVFFLKKNSFVFFFQIIERIAYDNHINLCITIIIIICATATINLHMWNILYEDMSMLTICLQNFTVIWVVIHDNSRKMPKSYLQSDAVYGRLWNFEFLKFHTYNSGADFYDLHIFARLLKYVLSTSMIYYIFSKNSSILLYN